jgi:hypothetical protein
VGAALGRRTPPAPPGTPERRIRKVEVAWRAWSHFRPDYRRDGEDVVAEINLKDNIWHGRGRGATEDEAAWNALQDCIDNWLRDVSGRVPHLAQWLDDRST